VAVQIVVYMLAPTLLLLAATKVPDVVRWWYQLGEREWRKRHPPLKSLRSDYALERLAADLRRLAADLDATASEPGVYARAHRMMAIAAAYDQTLLSTCRVLGVPMQTRRPPLSAVERLQAEASLAQEGVHW
jgi:hypothetical protein